MWSSFETLARGMEADRIKLANVFHAVFPACRYWLHVVTDVHLWQNTLGDRTPKVGAVAYRSSRRGREASSVFMGVVSERSEVLGMARVCDTVAVIIPLVHFVPEFMQAVGLKIVFAQNEHGSENVLVVWSKVLPEKGLETLGRSRSPPDFVSIPPHKFRHANVCLDPAKMQLTGVGEGTQPDRNMLWFRVNDGPPRTRFENTVRALTETRRNNTDINAKAVPSTLPDLIKWHKLLHGPRH